MDNQLRYSRSYNLRFVGIPEEPNPRQEDCITKLEEMISEHLNLRVDIENAHRVSQGGQDRPRHIIAKFLRRPERHQVFQLRNAFKESSTLVFEDLIPKDLETRKLKES